MRTTIAIACILLVPAVAATAGVQAAPPAAPERDRATALRRDAEDLSEKGRYSEARGLFEDLLEIQERILGADDPEIATTLDGLSNAQMREGNLSAARVSLERAIRIRRLSAPDDPVAIARTQHRLGIVLKNLGDYAAARSGFLESAAVFEAELGADDPQLVKSWNMLGIVARRTGDWEGGKHYFEQALELAVRSHGEEHFLVATVLMNHGNLLVDAGEPAAAVPYLERSLEIAKKIQGADNPDLAHKYNNLARCLLEIGEFERALPLAEHALALWERSFGKDHYHLSSAVDNLAGLTMFTRRDEQAEELYQRALSMRRRVYGPEHPEVAQSFIHLAQFRWLARKDARAAMEFALEGETIARRQFRRTAGGLTEEEALQFESIRFNGFNVALSALVSGAEVGDALKARVWDQLVRSRALVLDEMASRHWVTHRVASTELAPRVAALREARKTLAELVLRGPDFERPERYVAQLEQAKQIRDRAERALADGSRAFRESRRTALAGAEQVMAGLPTDAALVAYVHYEKIGWRFDEPDPSAVDYVISSEPTYLALVARADRAVPIVVPLGPAAEIEPLVAAWRLDAGSRPPSLRGPARRAEATYRESGAALRRRIWDPLIEAIGDAGRVFVVPDGALHLVSLSTLPTGDTGYLVESGPLLHHLSTERDLVRHANPMPPGKGLLALGGPDFDRAASRSPAASDGASADQPSAVPLHRGAQASCADLAEMRFEPLPASIAEVQDLAALWKREGHARPGGVRVLTAERATEAAVKSGAPGRRIVHLATHGFFAQDRCTSSLERARASNDSGGASVESPLLLSGLALAGANRRREVRADEDGEDGVLTAEEIASLDLAGVEWVVLSACETGVGRVWSGEGVLGLRRAFETAGAGTLIMSLWQVEDEATREWMGHLYRERLDGRATAEAVRRSSLAMIRARREAGAPTHPFTWGAFVAAGDWR